METVDLLTHTQILSAVMKQHDVRCSNRPSNVKVPSCISKRSRKTPPRARYSSLLLCRSKVSDNDPESVPLIVRRNYGQGWTISVIYEIHGVLFDRARTTIEYFT